MRPRSPRHAKGLWLLLRVVATVALAAGFWTGRIQTAINSPIDKTYHTTVDVLFFGGLAILMAASVTLLVLLLAQFGPKDNP